MNYSLLRSRTFWTIAAMFVIGGANAIMQFLPAGMQTTLMLVLSVLASYFHLETGRSTTGAN